MKKLNDYFLKYLLLSSPLVMVLLIWSIFQGQQEIIANNNQLIYIIWEILSWNLILWFLIVIYILFALLFMPTFRNIFLVKLARIKNRDEREDCIIAQSTKFTFFSTIALLFLLLFFSLINITIRKLPEGQMVNGRKHELSINLSYEIYKKNNSAEQDGSIIFSTKFLPLTNQNILLLIIIWHLGTFYYFSRKFQIEK